MKIPDLKPDQASPGSDVRERITQRLAQITKHHPSRAALFRSVYYSKASKARAVKAKCLVCCAWHRSFMLRMSQRIWIRIPSPVVWKR